LIRVQIYKILPRLFYWLIATVLLQNQSESRELDKSLAKTGKGKNIKINGKK